jgi:putative acyl-CoA dehydrogenase
VEEAIECIGGNAYIEEHPMARLYREAPINTIWEGTSNMMCMDVVRAIHRVPGALDAIMDEIRLGASHDRRIGVWAGEIERIARDRELAAQHARRLTEMLALGVQASLIARYSSGQVASAFLDTRLEKRSGRTFGTLENTVDLDAIIRRAALSEAFSTSRETVEGQGQLATSLDEVAHRALEASGLIQWPRAKA